MCTNLYTCMPGSQPACVRKLLHILLNIHSPYRGSKTWASIAFGRFVAYLLLVRFSEMKVPKGVAKNEHRWHKVEWRNKRTTKCRIYEGMNEIINESMSSANLHVVVCLPVWHVTQHADGDDACVNISLGCSYSNAIACHCNNVFMASPCLFLLLLLLQLPLLFRKEERINVVAWCHQCC